MSDERWAYLQAHALDEEYEPACVSFRGQPVGTVGLRFKGSVGTLVNCVDEATGKLKPPCTKLSLKVKFNEYDKGVHFHGLTRINLHSMVYDQTKLHERLAYDLYRDMGIPASRVTWAVVKVNGKSYGVYSLVEDVDARFVEQHWPEASSGNLFKEAWPDDPNAASYTDKLETNKSTGTGEAFASFYDALAAASPEQLNPALGTYTNLEKLYRYMAVDDAILNVDGVTAVYTNQTRDYHHNHNYYWYQDPTTPCFSLIPWDLDSTFTIQPSFASVPRWTETPADCGTTYSVWGDPNSLVSAPGCDLIFKALASDKASYQAAVQALLDGPFTVSGLQAKIDQLAGFIADEVTADPTFTGAANWPAFVKSLKDMVPVLRSRMELLRDGRTPTLLGLKASGVNDFETDESLGLALGTQLSTNASSKASQSINESSPLQGSKDLRVAFEYHNEKEPWQQWMYHSVPLTGGPHDMSAVTGIRLMVRSDKARTLRMDLESPANSAATQGIRAGWDLSVGSTITTLEVLMKDAQPPSWAAAQGKDPHDSLSAILKSVTGLAFQPICEGRDSQGFLPEGAPDQGFFEVDAIEFFTTQDAGP